MPLALKGGKLFGKLVNEDRLGAGHFSKPIGSKLCNRSTFALHGSGKVKHAPPVLKSKGH